MNLLEKAKVITTPTAYSDGILHSVKPNVILGDELVTNGTFDTDSNWTKTNAVIADGKATVTVVGGAYSVVRQPLFSYVSGRSYVLEAEVQGTSGKACTFFDNGSNIGGLTTSNGIINFDGSVQRVYIEWTANANSDAILCARNGTGDFEFTIDNVSVKEKIDADFTFTRNSSATRVGEDGYIQDVQIIGGELVQNGDFEQIGSELVTNGSFDTDSDWNKANATISGGKAIVNVVGGAFSYVYQSSIPYTSGKIYRFEVQVQGTSGYNIRFQDNTTNLGGFFQIITLDGTQQSFSYYFTANANSNVIQIARSTSSGDYSFSIDNVSVKEVGQNWSFNNVDFSLGQVNFDASSDWIFQSKSFTSGNKYRFTFSGSGDLRYRTGFNGTDGVVKTIPYLPYSVDIIATSDTNRVQIYGSDLGDGTLTNVSVKEVTDDTNLPRINYEGFSYENGLPIYGSGKGHFLLEGQSTNLVPYSSDFSQWTIQTNSIVTSNDTISPDGTQNASKLSAGTSVARQSIIYDADFSGDFFYSVFAKKGEYNVIQLTDARDGSRYANFDLNNGVIGSYDVCTPSIEDYGNGWYRCVMAFTQVGLLSIRISIAESPTQARLVNFAGNGSDGIYIWGAMLEVDNLSSYIPTNGSAVTRAAETCNNAGNADLFDSEGVLYADIAALANDGTLREITINDGTSSNAVEIRYSSTSNEIQYVVRSGGAVQVVEVFALDNALEFNKFAARYKENDFSLFVNGVQVITDTSGIEPVGLSKLHFFFAGGNNFYGKTKMVAVFPYLSNDEMECLTGEGYGTFQAMALANNYTIIQG